MAAWIFYDYVTGEDDEKPNCNLMAEWYLTQDQAVRAQFDFTLGLLRAQPDWQKSKSFMALVGKHKGLGEVRFRLHAAKGRPIRRFRPVGAWPPKNPGEFVLILGCEKGMNGILKPPGAFDLALKYKAQMESGRGYTDERKLANERN